MDYIMNFQFVHNLFIRAFVVGVLICFLVSSMLMGMNILVRESEPLFRKHFYRNIQDYSSINSINELIYCK